MKSTLVILAISPDKGIQDSISQHLGKWTTVYCADSPELGLAIAREHHVHILFYPVNYRFHVKTMNYSTFLSEIASDREPRFKIVVDHSPFPNSIVKDVYRSLRANDVIDAMTLGRMSKDDLLCYLNSVTHDPSFGV